MSVLFIVDHLLLQRYNQNSAKNYTKSLQEVKAKGYALFEGLKANGNEKVEILNIQFQM